MSPSSSLPPPLSFLHVIRNLKTTPRTGWVNHNIPNPESISDHMYRMACILMIMPMPGGIDKAKCVMMALVHDMAEAIVGDITPLDGVSKTEKHRRESEAMQFMTSLLPGPYAQNATYISSLFDEYEQGQSPEAILVKDVDKYELVLQAVEYERDAVDRGDTLNGLQDLDPFFGVRKGIKSDLVKGWADDVMKEREQVWSDSSKKGECAGPASANGVTKRHKD